MNETQAPNAAENPVRDARLSAAPVIVRASFEAADREPPPDELHCRPSLLPEQLAENVLHKASQEPRAENQIVEVDQYSQTAPAIVRASCEAADRESPPDELHCRPSVLPEQLADNALHKTSQRPRLENETFVEVDQHSRPASIGHNARTDALFHDVAIQAVKFETAIKDEQQHLLGLVDQRKETTGRLAQAIVNLLKCLFQMAKLTKDGTTPASVMEAFIQGAGIKKHGNDEIPYSRLVRAVMHKAAPESNDDQSNTSVKRRATARASTYASALDYAIQSNMELFAFEQELNRRPERGQRHGLEYLASQGRKIRRAAKPNGGPASGTTEPSANAGTVDRQFTVTGDLEGIGVGWHVLIVEIPPGGGVSGVPAVLAEHDETTRALLAKYKLK